ncbi:MAG: CsgG/HfaB family protein [Spirochaetia bacterium]|jgi:TolB-like protein|nr:CsgG/HfaB family protein [Spirochaetia bacterium]
MPRKFFVVFLLVLCAAAGFGQNVVTLDQALGAMTVYFTGRLPDKSKIVILNMTSTSDKLSEYVIEELTVNFVNDGKLTVVDRQNLDAIRQEMNFQMSGEVDEASAQEIGRKLGAQTILSGSINLLGDVYRMRVRAISVQTAAIQGMHTANVGQDKILAALTGSAPSSGTRVAPVAVAPVPAAAPAAAPAAPAVQVGKPVRKTPAKAGNFELIQGAVVSTPIDPAKFHTAALAMIRELEFEILDDKQGFVLFKHSRGSAWVHIKLCYWSDEYWYEYVASDNLDADPGRDRIHRNYRRWIENAEKEMRKFYYR